MRVAFASTDGIHVNQHFGWCERFYIYELNETMCKALESIDSSQKFDAEIEKLEYKLSCIDGCDLLYVLQIGPKAATLVKSAGIFPLKAPNESESIQEVLKKLQAMMDSPPLWLKRIMLKKEA